MLTQLALTFTLSAVTGIMVGNLIMNGFKYHKQSSTIVMVVGLIFYFISIISTLGLIVCIYICIWTKL